MSLGIGGDYATQRLQSLFAQMSATQTTSTGGSTNSAPSTQTSPATAPDNCLTGSSQAQLSGDILSTLMQLQSGSGTTNPSGTTSTTGTTDPAQSLFSAMDTDGDGEVSQTEMESYLESNGATQGQADAVYSALDPNGSSGGIGESTLASAAQQASPPPGGPGGPGGHHHHHHAQSTDGTSDSSNPLDQLMSLIDSSNSTSGGAIGQDAFSNFVTSNGGTAADAQSDFAALDTDGSGTLTSADFATTWQNAQTAQGSNGLMVSMLDAFAKANNAVSSSSTTGATTSVSA